MSTAAAWAMTLAIVTQDQVPLRAAPRTGAAQHATLAQGDVVELRGERLDHLQVWDPRRERAGFVRATQLRPIGTAAADAPALLAVLRFVRETPGSEALGIAYAAAYLKAVPAERLDAEAFDAIGSMAERLARRSNAAAAAMRETVAQYGVRYVGIEVDGVQHLCYDGEAFQRVLALPAAAEARARAALALTRHDCIDPALPPLERRRLDERRAAALDALDGTTFAALPEPLKNRLRLRRAGVWAALAFQQARAGEPARAAAERALAELAAVGKAELADDDQADYDEAAVRAGAVRWAAVPASQPAALAGGMTLATEPGEPGQTCLHLRRGHATLLRHCTHATVWTASARIDARSQTVALAVQPLAHWTELWLLRPGPEGWRVDVLPPATQAQAPGTIEFAGWVGGAQPQMLVAREAVEGARTRRSFEVVDLGTLATVRRASTPGLLAAFARWQDAAWARQTVMLR